MSVDGSGNRRCISPATMTGIWQLCVRGSCFGKASGAPTGPVRPMHPIARDDHFRARVEVVVIGGVPAAPARQNPLPNVGLPTNNSTAAPDPD